MKKVKITGSSTTDNNLTRKQTLTLTWTHPHPKWCQSTRHMVNSSQLCFSNELIVCQKQWQELTLYVKHGQVVFTQLMTYHICTVAMKWLIDILLQGHRQELMEGVFLFSFPLPPLPLSSPLPPYPFPSFHLPLEIGPPLNQLEGLGSAVRSPSQKRIWCTLELSESHWWQTRPQLRGCSDTPSPPLPPCVRPCFVVLIW